MRGNFTLYDYHLSYVIHPWHTKFYFVNKCLAFLEDRLWFVYLRIRTEKLGGAWCPSQLITRNVTEWLQVEFPSLHVISVLETQGRFGNGQVS